MNPEHEDKLAAEISRALRKLPDLEAPRTLMWRVTMALQQGAGRPWCRGPWQSWPNGVQRVALLILLALLGGLGFGAWRACQTEPVIVVLHRISSWCSLVMAFGDVLNAMGGSLILVIRHLGLPFLVGCLAGLAFVYALILGLGTIWLRVARAASVQLNGFESSQHPENLA